MIDTDRIGIHAEGKVRDPIDQAKADADYCAHCGDISTQMHVVGEYVFCETCWQSAEVKTP